MDLAGEKGAIEIYKGQLAIIKDKSLWLLSAAKRHTSGDIRRMAQRLLDDFRKNLLGNITLELP